MTTMLLFEAHPEWERAALSIVPRARGADLASGLQAGLIPCVTTRAALRKALRAFWQQPARFRPADLSNAYVQELWRAPSPSSSSASGLLQQTAEGRRKEDHRRWFVHGYSNAAFTP